jgi:proteasome lid subunit RPN8/RPN11
MAANDTSPDVASPPDSSRLDLAGVMTRPFPYRDPEYRVLIEERAYDAVMSHAASEPEIEVCGVLVGDVGKDEEGPYLIITHAIRGRSARERKEQVTFTHSTWELINREMDEKYPDSRIVGWYHTHPGYGVFLSEVDLFAHSHFFNADWQVAMVVDQKAGREGLFFWSDGAVVRARRYWVGQEPRWEPRERPAVSAPPGPGRTARPATTAGEEGPAGVEPTRWLSIALAAACSVLLLLYIRADFQNERLAAELEGLRRQPDQESREGGRELARALAFRLRAQLDSGRPPKGLDSIIDEILRLDPGHRSSYEALLPELVPMRPADTRPAAAKDGEPAAKSAAPQEPTDARQAQPAAKAQ